MTGISKTQAFELVQSIDLIGMTMCLDAQSPAPPHVKEATILMLGSIRAMLADAYGINLDPKESIFGTDDAVKRTFSASEVADEIFKDLDNG